MNSDESDLESFSDSELSESFCELEVDSIASDEDSQVDHGHSLEAYGDPVPYAEEPLADETWIEQYEREKEEIAKQEEILQKRLNGTTPVQEWCRCGKCDTSLLQNISEFYCCKELEGCEESLESDLVAQDLDEGEALQCITSHPGFAPVCLQKWSLRLASDKYRTSEKKAYRQTGSEESFLRSIAYREFTRMVYGFLGKKKRIPLPACAYSSMRIAFPNSEDEVFSGFEMADLDF